MRSTHTLHLLGRFCMLVIGRKHAQRRGGSPQRGRSKESTCSCSSTYAMCGHAACSCCLCAKHRPSITASRHTLSARAHAPADTAALLPRTSPQHHSPCHQHHHPLLPQTPLSPSCPLSSLSLPLANCLSGSQVSCFLSECFQVSKLPPWCWPCHQPSHPCAVAVLVLAVPPPPPPHSPHHHLQETVKKAATIVKNKQNCRGGQETRQRSMTGFEMQMQTRKGSLSRLIDTQVHPALPTEERSVAANQECLLGWL